MNDMDDKERAEIIKFLLDDKKVKEFAKIENTANSIACIIFYVLFICFWLLILL